MSPMARCDPAAADPMNVQAALGAVEGEVLKLAFEVGLHVQQLQPKHLGVNDQRIGAARSRSLRSRVPLQVSSLMRMSHF